MSNCVNSKNCDVCNNKHLNTIYLVQGLDRQNEGNTEWETILVDDTYAGLLGKWDRLDHKSNWQEFRMQTTQIPRYGEV